MVPTNTSIELVLDDGVYSEKKFYPLGLNEDSLVCVVNYFSVADSIKIYLKVGDKDSTMYVDQKNQYKALIGVDLDKNPFISTDFGFWNPKL